MNRLTRLNYALAAGLVLGIAIPLLWSIPAELLIQRTLDSMLAVAAWVTHTLTWWLQ